MTTQKSSAGNETWVDIVADLSLVNETQYTIQNITDTVVLLSEKNIAPVDGDGYHKIKPGEFQSITPESGQGLWIKATGNANSVTVAVTEAA